MIRQVIFILILSLVITSCGGAPAATQEVMEQPVATEEPIQPLAADTALNTPTPAPTQTFTPEATFTPAITPTETLLPALALPTEVLNAPALMVWDGTPTYLGDSTPGYAFRVTYNPDLWALTADQFGYPAIGHRNIQYCVISVTSGRGMPASVTVEHDILHTEDVTFDVGIAYESGVMKFITYTGGDGTIITAFEVSFQEQSETCIADAVTVLSTLRSVPVSQATPQP